MYTFFVHSMHTGNNFHGGHMCPIQFYGDVCSDDKFESKKSYAYNIQPDELILASTTAFCGLNNQWYKDNIDKTTDISKYLVTTSNILNKLFDNNIYVIGWNIVETTLNILNINALRLNLNLSYQYKAIDVAKFAKMLLPINEIGFMTLRSTHIYCNNGNVDDNSIYLKENYCKQCVEEIKYILTYLMKKHNFKTLDEVYDFITN